MILDTNALSDLFEGHPELGKLLEDESRHQVPVFVLGEYRYGLLGSCQAKKIGPLLDRLEEESIVLAPDSATAHAYADVRMKLKRQGTPIPENDVWIAALAIQHDLPLASRDEHFDQVPGLTRVGW